MLKTSIVRDFFVKHSQTLRTWIKEHSGGLSKDELINKYKQSKSYVKQWDKTTVVEKATSTLQHIDPKRIMEFTKSRWGKRVLWFGAGLLTFNATSHLLNTILAKPKLPDNYERGYDVLESSMTDFGSPLHLAKSAAKTLNPYFSTVRKGLKTSTNIIMMSNPALTMSRNAIKHYKY